MKFFRTTKDFRCGTFTHWTLSPVEMARQRKRNARRPFDMAISDYCHGNDLLWQKLYGEQEKPADWRWDAEGVQLPPVTVTWRRNPKTGCHPFLCYWSWNLLLL